MEKLTEAEIKDFRKWAKGIAGVQYRGADIRRSVSKETLPPHWRVMIAAFRRDRLGHGS